MEGHSQLANCVRRKTMALFKPWRYLVPKPPNLDVAKEGRILCDVCFPSYFSRENSSTDRMHDLINEWYQQTTLCCLQTRDN